MLSNLMTPTDASNLFSQGPPGPPGRLVGVESSPLASPFLAPVASCISLPNLLP